MTSSAQQIDTTTMEVDGKVLDVPNAFLCPITLQIMVHPVMTLSGLNFERSAIFSWLRNGEGSCPLTRKPMKPSDLVSNKNLEHRIACWRFKNGISEKGEQDDVQCQNMMGFLPVPGEQMDSIIGRHVVKQLSVDQRMSLVSSLRLASSPSRHRTATSRPTTTTRTASRGSRISRLNFLKNILSEAQEIEDF